jgi:hypothetical protein
VRSAAGTGGVSLGGRGGEWLDLKAGSSGAKGGCQGVLDVGRFLGMGGHNGLSHSAHAGGAEHVLAGTPSPPPKKQPLVDWRCLTIKMQSGRVPAAGAD